MFVCPFPTDPKYWKIKVSFFFLILNFAFVKTKMIKLNVRIRIVTVSKRHFNQTKWNTIPLQHYDLSNSGALHVQERMILHFFCVKMFS